MHQTTHKPVAKTPFNNRLTSPIISQHNNGQVLSSLANLMRLSGEGSIGMEKGVSSAEESYSLIGQQACSTCGIELGLERVEFRGINYCLYCWGG